MNNIYSTLNHCKKNTLPLVEPAALVPLAAPAPPVPAAFVLVPAPLVPAPLVPARRKKPPSINRNIKPEIITFIDGIVEESY